MQNETVRIMVLMSVVCGSTMLWAQTKTAPEIADAIAQEAPETIAVAPASEVPSDASAENALPQTPDTPQPIVDDIDIDGDDAALKKKEVEVKVVSGTDEQAIVTINCDDTALADVIKQFRKATGANIIAGTSSNLMQKVSVTLERVAWQRGLSSILSTYGLRLEERGNIYRVTEDQIAVPVFTRTYQLNHASAEELATLFNKTFGDKTATPFAGANVVIVTGTEKVLNECENVIKTVDKAVPQVCIEARFLELNADAARKLGVDWSSLSSWGGSINNVSGTMGYNVGDLNGGAAIASSSKRHYRGINGTLSADDFRLALSAFDKLDGATVFSNPKIIVSNGKEALVDMTTKFPCVEVTSSRDTSSGVSSIDITAKLVAIPGEDALMFAKEAFFSFGITLEVTPRISPDGIINVDIVPTISQLDKTVFSSPDNDGFFNVGGTANTSPYSKYPIIEVKRLTTSFAMKDGSTAVIGGLSRTKEETIDTGIPGLRSIPWIGEYLFGWKSRQKVQKEIVICVTMSIADPGNLRKDIGLPKNAVLGRDYVEGSRLEPGDRPRGTALSITDEDMAAPALQPLAPAPAEKVAEEVEEAKAPVAPAIEQPVNDTPAPTPAVEETPVAPEEANLLSDQV